MTQASSKLTQLYRKLEKLALAQVEPFTKHNPTYLKRYAQNFESMLPKNISIQEKKEWLQCLNGKDYILVGDFHSLLQSQHAFLQMTQMLSKNFPEKSLKLFFECFSVDDQENVNQFLNEKISLDKLREKTNFDQSWGFLWNSYVPILTWAQKYNIPVFGINSKADKSLTPEQGLVSRDKIAAKTIIQNSDANSFSLVLIGEYHLADEHLPKEMLTLSPKSASKMMRVVVNADQYFYTVFPQISEQGAAFYQLRKDILGFSNCSPWIKWLSSAWSHEWQDHQNPILTSHNVNHSTEDQFDLDFHMKQLAEVFSTELDLPMPKLSHWDIEHKDNRKKRFDWDDLESFFSIQESKKKLTIHHFMPEIVVYMVCKEISENLHLDKVMASQFLFTERNLEALCMKPSRKVA